MSDLSVETTPIPGLLVVRLPVHRDDRGWFKENWQREKMVALGLPDFGPVQNNISFNAARGTTRGIHTEPWDKFVSIASGRAFAAWVDMRAGETFGTTYWAEVDESIAVFVPRGVGNSYQALADNTVYSYLVNDHWRPGRTYPALRLDDPTVAIPWPFPLDDGEVEISAKDQGNPLLADVDPVPARRMLITGGGGQVGRALATQFPTATVLDHAALDLTDHAALEAWPWEEYEVILNAAAYTAVDEAETPEGRAAAWSVNATAPAALARVATEHGITVVHYSTDYVFGDAGDRDLRGHTEDEPFAPLNVYGQSKAAGDLAVACTPRHYILRTSWVIGDGHNFVRTMRWLAADGVDPAVVGDQIGRLTFTDELARATRHLLECSAPYGTYNATNAGVPRSWAGYARRVFERTGHDPERVRTVSTAEYAAGRSMAPRPELSVLALDKLAATGFISTDADDALAAYLRGSRSRIDRR